MAAALVAGRADAADHGVTAFVGSPAANRTGLRDPALSARGFVGSAQELQRPSRGAFIASVPIASNAAIGVGRFNSLPKRRLGPEPLTLEPPKFRRAAVGLSLKF
ncbi:MAG: hypothetical protein ACJ8EY_08965 [Sphingomicrobium sp.]